MLGSDASRRVAEIGRGAPPLAETRQRLPSAPLREDANTTSRLSAVQVMPLISWRSNVSCFADPPAARITKISDAIAETSRWNAIHSPLGENAGNLSLCEAVIS